MSTTPGLGDAVRQARSLWQQGRDAIRLRHEAGAPGPRTVKELCDLLDSVILELHRAAVEAIDPALDQAVTLVMHGGCGRREFAPWSDVDLMLLYQGNLRAPLEQYARRILQDINDIGLRVGSSLRTPREACTMAADDPQIFSSLTESRFLAGNIDQFAHYLSRLKRMAQKRQAALVRGIIDARTLERNQYGETVYLLRPNLKRSPGALRDVHLIRWLGFVRFGETDLDQLVRNRALTAGDANQLHAANGFLLKLRCEMHFHAGRLQDGLGRNEQVRLASQFGYPSEEGVLPVESMMQDYFRMTSLTRYLADQVTAVAIQRGSLTRTMLAPLLSRQLEGTYRIGPTRIGFEPAHAAAAQRDLLAILRLIRLAIQHGRPIEQETWLAIREAMSDEQPLEWNPEIAAGFLALLAEPRQLGAVLRMLHELHVLEKIIPDFGHAWGLLQFNEYHHYTVDEHTLRAVEICCGFGTDPGLRGRVWRSLEHPRWLLLALLLHDLGKGFAEEHCEVGKRIAERIGERMGLNADDTETVRFLVHNHLMMSHLAFHRDIGNQSTVAEFAANLGSAQLLAMLYLLTWADISAVGPGVMTAWKDELLTKLFLHAHEQLTGQPFPDSPRRELDYRVEQIAGVSTDPAVSAWLRETARPLPASYLSSHPPAEVAAKLLELRSATAADVFTTINAVPGRGSHELSIAKRERIRSGIFYKVTGMLASQGLRVHAAEIKPLGSQLLWYWFLFEDGDFRDCPESRLEEIRQRAHAIATGEDQEPPRFRSTWKEELTPASRLSLPQIDVEIDNLTVEDATIIDVFAWNKLGLLYNISRRIYQLDLDVRFARISTWGHQVLDVFYVTDNAGRKIHDRLRLNTIRQELLASIREFLGEAPAGGDPDPESAG